MPPSGPPGIPTIRSMTHRYNFTARSYMGRGVASSLVALAALLGTLAPTATAQTHSTDSLDVKPPLAVEITDLSVLGRAAVGERFVVQVRYVSRIDGSAVLAINLPHNVDPLGHAVRRVDGAPSLEVPLVLRADGQGVATFPLRVTTAGPLMIAAQIRVPDAPEGFARYAWEHLEVDSRAGQATVRNPKREGAFRPTKSAAVSSGALNAAVAADSPFFSSGVPAAAEPVTAQSMTLYQFTVTGRAYFNDELGAPKGVWGAKVRLYLRRAGSLFQTVSGDMPGVHHVVVDENGQYSFNFTYNGTIQSTDELVAFVSSATPAIVLRTGTAYTFYGEPYFTEAWSVPLQGLGTNISIARDAVIPPGYGAVLRYTTLAREAVNAAYGGSPPFSTSPRYAPNQSDIYIEELDGCGRYRISWAWFDYTRRLSIDPVCTQIQTIPHEYGHWLHEALTGRDTFTDADLATAEGFAVFHSFATRGWASSRYGDPTRAWSDNPESAPYDVGSGENGQTVRFRNFKYAYGGDPEVGAVGSFLWAVYDGPDDRDLETTAYDIGDNDDVKGQPLYVYDAFRLSGPEAAPQVRDAVLAQTPPTLDPSVMVNYNFMFASMTAVPLTPALPVQASSLTGQASSSTSVQFSWATNQYPFTGPFVNAPQGYRIYKGSTLVATVSASTSSYTYTNSGGIAGTYKVTAYNSAGESALAPSTTVNTPFSASISGPSILAWKQQGTYTAGYSGGSGTVSYLWSTRSPGASTWNSTGVTAQTYTVSMVYTGGVELQAQVTRGGQTAYATRLVSYCAASPCLDELAAGSLSEAAEAALKASGAPALFAVHAPRPNPTRGAVEVRYDLPEAAAVRVAVYDVTGREVSVLAEGATEAGYHRATLDPAALPAGVYLVRVTAGREVAVRQLTVVR